MVTVSVAGSLAEARAAGLFHPNCRHDVRAYLLGLTKQRPKPEARGTYEDAQRQRYYERQIRRWKREAAGAMNEQKATTARAKVRSYQARIRELVADTGLPRKSRREQLTTAR